MPKIKESKDLSNANAVERENKSAALRKFKSGIFNSVLEKRPPGESKNQVIAEGKEYSETERKEALERKLESKAYQLNDKIRNIEAVDPDFFKGVMVDVKFEVENLSKDIADGIRPPEIKPVEPQQAALALSPPDQPIVSPLEKVQALAETLEPRIRKAELHVRLAQIEKQILDIQENDYQFLMDNQARIKREIDLSLTLLLKEQFEEINDKTEQKKIVWLNLYALACMLEAFHEAYAQEIEKEKYTKLRAEIKAFLEQGKGARFRPPEAEEHFKAHLKKKFEDSIKELKSLPFHTSKIKNLLGFLNLWRIYWIFGRLSIIKGLQNTDILNAILEFEKAFHDAIPLDGLTNSNFDGIISIIKAPRHIYDVLSIGLFSIRLAIDTVTAIKHIYKPTELERDSRGVLAKLLAKHAVTDNLALRRAIFNQFDLKLDEIPPNDQLTAEWFQKALKNKYKTRSTHEQIKGLLKTIEIEALLKAPGLKLNLLQHYKKELYLKAPSRVGHEVFRRHGRNSNDGFWMIVNFLCNYDYITGFTDPVGIGLTAAFLVF